MSNPSNLWSAIRTTTPSHWGNSLKWLTYTIGCGFLPVMVGLLLVWGLSANTFKLDDFVIHGEFAIYSAALIAGSTRLIAKDTDTFPFVHRELFVLLAILIIVGSVTLYSAIKTATLLSLQNTVNTQFIMQFSLPLVIVSLVFSFFVFLLDQQRISPNIRGIIKRQEQKLSAEYDNLGDPQ